jgi:Co/Zn/Cd efflux system component
VALLTDVIHNGGDALTAVPLGIAFVVRSARAERWAGYVIVAVILASAATALVEVVERLLNPRTPAHLWGLLAAGLVGVVGNEVAALIRWRAGRRLDSPALIADGNHARTDGYVSAGIAVSAAFIAAGLPIADPIIGLVIVAIILQATWSSWLTIRSRPAQPAPPTDPDGGCRSAGRSISTNRMLGAEVIMGASAVRDPEPGTATPSSDRRSRRRPARCGRSGSAGS